MSNSDLPDKGVLVNHISRLFLFVGLAACAGGSQAPVGPDPVEAQTTPAPKPNPNQKMPPAAPMNLLGIAGQVVGVLPSTLVVARDSLAGKAPFTDRASSTKWVDMTLVAGEVLLENGKHTGALPGRVLRGPHADRQGERKAA